MVRPGPQTPKRRVIGPWEERLPELAAAAWRVRRNARILGSTAVGAAVLDSHGGLHVGCNVEHRFRSHDVHAEVNAIGNMVAVGEQQLVAVLVAAERERFTPCGACLDWIFEFGGDACVVAVQNVEGGSTEALTAGSLMPHYPR